MFKFSRRRFLDGIKIRQYERIVVVLNVRVINIIRDFFTYFCDIFGGWSESYQDVTKDMENDVIAKVPHFTNNATM